MNTHVLACDLARAAAEVARAREYFVPHRAQLVEHDARRRNLFFPRGVALCRGIWLFAGEGVYAAAHMFAAAWV